MGDYTAKVQGSYSNQGQGLYVNATDGVDQVRYGQADLEKKCPLAVRVHNYCSQKMSQLSVNLGTGGSPILFLASFLLIGSISLIKSAAGACIEKAILTDYRNTRGDRFLAKLNAGCHPHLSAEDSNRERVLAANWAEPAGALLAKDKTVPMKTNKTEFKGQPMRKTGLGTRKHGMRRFELGKEPIPEPLSLPS